VAPVRKEKGEEKKSSCLITSPRPFSYLPLPPLVSFSFTGTGNGSGGRGGRGGERKGGEGRGKKGGGRSHYFLNLFLFPSLSLAFFFRGCRPSFSFYRIADMRDDRKRKGKERGFFVPVSIAPFLAMSASELACGNGKGEKRGGEEKEEKRVASHLFTLSSNNLFLRVADLLLHCPSSWTADHEKGGKKGRSFRLYYVDGPKPVHGRKGRRKKGGYPSILTPPPNLLGDGKKKKGKAHPLLLAVLEHAFLGDKEWEGKSKGEWGKGKVSITSSIIFPPFFFECVMPCVSGKKQRGGGGGGGRERKGGILFPPASSITISLHLQSPSFPSP